MSISSQKNIGAYIASSLAGLYTITNITAAGTNDNTLITCAYVDLGVGARPLSCSVVFNFKSTLINTQTVSLAAYMQSTDNTSNASSWANVAAQASTLAATGTTGNIAQYGTLDVDFDLSSAKRYVRLLFTPLCSGTGTDTVNIYPPVMILGGQAVLPV